MSSIDAQNVAKEVLETIGKGKKVVLGEIIKKNGYSEVTAKVPTTVTNTQSYQREIKPFLDKLVAHREKIIRAMDKKDLNKEQYRVLTDALQKSNHDIQLLSGGETERLNIVGVNINVRS